ncbi:MAG TPA: hypothetical protein VKB46_26415, partial [Pyrinomonadaceae bacterium]|nr:hypothetical protein [Pyrinomonadaceae bacterium]
MSFDLEIVTSLKPLSKHLEEFFSLLEGFNVTGALTGDANVLITRKNQKDSFCFTVDGPFQVEIEDLDERVIASVLNPVWLTQISIPAGASKADLKLAKQLAQSLADNCRGAVYDPQLDKVVWPRKSYRRFVAPVQEERIRLIGLDWYLPPDQSSVETAKLLLRTLRKACPEAAPRRFGTFEPLQHRLGSDDESFLSVWNEVSRVEYGDMLFWKSQSPCYGGDIVFPNRKHDPPPGAKLRIHLSLSFDGRALLAMPAWSETVVKLFVEVARQMRAFYGLGYVQRNVIARRSIGFDGRSEPSPTLPGQWWLGLPAKPTWLAWFGGGYARALAASLRDVASAQMPEGILLRHGDAPRDVDELTGLFPLLPPALFAEKDGDQYRPAEFIP